MLRLKQNEKPQFGVVYAIPKSELVINSDLRTINEKDKTLTEHLMDSIKRNGIIMPITVWFTPEGKKKIITGNRRKYCADKLTKIEDIPVIFETCKDSADYMRKAFHSNMQKASKISELVKTFRIEVLENNLPPKKVAASYGVSEKSVYSALKVSTDRRLEKLAEKNFKNAVHMASNKSFLENPKVMVIAETGTIDELKNALTAARKAKKLEQTGEETTTDKKEFLAEKKSEFFLQLENFAHKTIDTKNLKAFLYGEIESWF